MACEASFSCGCGFCDRHARYFTELRLITFYIYLKKNPRLLLWVSIIVLFVCMLAFFSFTPGSPVPAMNSKSLSRPTFALLGLLLASLLHDQLVDAGGSSCCKGQEAACPPQFPKKQTSISSNGGSAGSSSCTTQGCDCANVCTTEGNLHITGNAMQSCPPPPLANCKTIKKWTVKECKGKCAPKKKDGPECSCGSKCPSGYKEIGEKDCPWNACDTEICQEINPPSNCDCKNIPKEDATKCAECDPGYELTGDKQCRSPPTPAPSPAPTPAPTPATTTQTSTTAPTSTNVPHATNKHADAQLDLPRDLGEIVAGFFAETGVDQATTCVDRNPYAPYECLDTYTDDDFSSQDFSYSGGATVSSSAGIGFLALNLLIAVVLY